METRLHTFLIHDTYGILSFDLFFKISAGLSSYNSVLFLQNKKFHSQFTIFLNYFQFSEKFSEIEKFFLVEGMGFFKKLVQLIVPKKSTSLTRSLDFKLGPFPLVEVRIDERPLDLFIQICSQGLHHDLVDLRLIFFNSEGLYSIM